MAKASLAQIHELGLQIQRGQIPMWKIPAVFGIVEDDPLGKYLRLVEEARKELISAEQVQALLEGKDEALGIFKVTVDYGQTFEQMVAAGHFCWVDRKITPEYFPISGEGKVERAFVHVHLNRVIDYKKIVVEMNRRGLRSAKIEELLAVAQLKQLPSEQIATFGRGFLFGGLDLCFPQLSRSPDGLVLEMARLPEEDWAEWYHFLAVRKDAA